MRDPGREPAERGELPRVADRRLQLTGIRRRLEVRRLPRDLGSIGRELLAHRVEEGAELAELVLLRQIEMDAEFSLTEPRQAAADHVNRPQQQLRQQRRYHHRHRQRGERRQQRRRQRLIEILANQQRRHANARRGNFPVAQHQRPAELQVLPLAGVDRDELRERRARQQRAEIGRRRQRLPLERSIGVRDDHAARVGERGIHDVLRIQARFENRSQSGVGAQRRQRIGAAHLQLLRALIDRVGHQLGARAALVEADARQLRQVQHAQDDDHHADQGGDAEDLLAFNA